MGMAGIMRFLPTWFQLRRSHGLQPGFDALGQRAKVAYALHFVIRQFDTEMVFEPCEQFERLQTVNAQRFEKVVGRCERRAFDFEMGRRERQDFINDLFESFHMKIACSPAFRRNVSAITTFRLKAGLRTVQNTML